MTALPPLAAYHDLRWVFAFGQSWLGFVAVLAGMLIVRAALDAVLVRLAWPSPAQLPAPRFMTAFWSCAVLTVLVWVLLSPVVTLMFGVALVPFSWPFLAAVPILLGSVLALSHGGVGAAWWRRLPAASTVGWLLTGFVVLSIAAAALPYLDTLEFIGVAALAGLLNARAWYGVTVTAVRHAQVEVPQTWHWRAMLWEARQALRRRTSWVPVAPVAAVLVLALVVGLARLAFTGTLHLTPTVGQLAAGAAAVGTEADGPPGLQAGLGPPGPQGVWGEGSPQSRGGQGGSPPQGKTAILVVGGFGSNCCNDANTLRASEPGMLVRQFSYLGLNAAGQPISYHRAADLPIQVLGDRMAAQVKWIYAHAHATVDIVAESEGTLGLYAMLARHPGLPIGSVVALSPIVEPGQFGQGGVPGAALIMLNNLIGKMSPYGPAGAEELIDSVSEFGASYFADVSKQHGFRWLAVVPLADAVTMPACPFPPNLVFVQALHGGLLGDLSVRQMIEEFLAGQTDVRSSQRLRDTARVISAAAAAWRMPDLHASCTPG